MMEGIISVLSGLLVLLATVVAGIIGYKRIRDEWLHSILIFLIFAIGVTWFIAAGDLLGSVQAAAPWSIYAAGASDSFLHAIFYAVFVLIAFPLYIEAIWWLACLLHFIARHVPTPNSGNR